MSFLAIIISVGLFYFLGSAKLFHHDKWFYRWLDLFSYQQPFQALHVLTVLGLPCLALLLIYQQAGTFLWGLPELALSIIVIMYSIGRGEYKGVLSKYAKQWRKETISYEFAEQALQRLQQSSHYQCITDGESDVKAEDLYGLHIQIREQLYYCSLQRVFAVLFWLAVLGPVAAFAYRLLVLYLRYFCQLSQAGLQAQDNTEDALPGQNAEKMTFAYQLLYFLEWPASRLQGLCYALVGNFSQVITLWLNTVTDFKLSISYYLSSLANATLDFQTQWGSAIYTSSRSEEELAKKAADEIFMSIALYQRSLVFSLLGIALFEIFVF